MPNLFKYYPKDFGALTVKVLHMDLDFDVYNDHTNVIAHMNVQALQDIKSLQLNAKNLEVHQVSCKNKRLEWQYDKEKSFINNLRIRNIHNNHR